MHVGPPRIGHREAFAGIGGAALLDSRGVGQVGRAEPVRSTAAGPAGVAPPVSDPLSQDLASLKIDRTPRRRGRGPATLVTLAVLCGLAAVGYLFVYPRVRSAWMTSEVSVGEITLVSPAQAQIQLSATGYVVAELSAKVAAKVPGRIAELFVVEGQQIERGATVARLEDIDHRSTLATARSRAAVARARVKIARAQVAELRISIDRDRPLADRGVIARAPVDDMEARLAALLASVKAAEAEAVAMDAEARSLEVQLDSYLIVSPIAGTVVDKLVEVGEGVAPGFGLPGVVEVVDMSSLVVEVDVPESRLDQVDPGQPAEIVLDAYPEQRFGGRVKELGRRVNRAKATVPVKVAFEDRPAQVLPEMAARVSFLREDLGAEARKAPPRLVVPTSAVVQRDGGDVVFTLDDDRVRMMTVEVGAPFAGGRVLETPLPVGTQVVLAPPADLTDGQKVKEKP